MSLPSSYLKLTAKQRIYVDSQLKGLSKKASARAAGSHNSDFFENSENVQQALVDMLQQNADEIGFSRREAHDMYMEAYQNAETAMEQIAAVNAMVKLHGLEKPKQVEITHEHIHSGKIEHLPTAELGKLAGMQEALTLEGEYEEVGEKPVLEAPDVTEDNTIDYEELPNVSEGYRA